MKDTSRPLINELSVDEARYIVADALRDFVPSDRYYGPRGALNAFNRLQEAINE